MANQTPLATWLYSKREELNPRFKEFNWPKQWLTDLFDFSTIITWNGMTVEGRGVDERRENALEKSVAEAIEHLICLSNKTDSVGFAVAGTHDPSSHAKNEALERFYLHYHVQNQIPFETINDHFTLAQEFRKNKSASAVQFYRMRTSPDFFGVVCLMTSQETQKLSLGFALSMSLEESIRRSMLEALPCYVWLVNSEKRDESASADLPWHIAPQFLNQILPLLSKDFSSKVGSIINAPELKSVDVGLNKISILSDAPIYAARFVVSTTEATA